MKNKAMVQAWPTNISILIVSAAGTLPQSMKLYLINLVKILRSKKECLKKNIIIIRIEVIHKIYQPKRPNPRCSSVLHWPSPQTESRKRDGTTVWPIHCNSWSGEANIPLDPGPPALKNPPCPFVGRDAMISLVMTLKDKIQCVSLHTHSCYQKFSHLDSTVNDSSTLICISSVIK